MPADNEMPEDVRKCIAQAREYQANPSGQQYSRSYGFTGNAIRWLADALDKAQWERNWILAQRPRHVGTVRLLGETTVKVLWYGDRGESYETEGHTFESALAGAMMAYSQLAASLPSPEGKL